MKYKFLIFIAVSIFLSTPLFAEFIFLTNGAIVEGKITGETADTITLRTKDRKTLEIRRSTIMRILYTELKLGKVYVQKRDGESVLAYMVDENRESYTFRKELYKPQEFILKRDDVLFIAEKNPSGLKIDGETGQKSIPLKWLPPYDIVKKYNIYLKEKKTDKYVLIKSTQSKTAVITGVKSNTEYFIIVTSVDSDNYESSPSNEIKVITKNIPPSKPAIKSAVKTGTGEREIKWEESVDEDGTVKNYNIYGMRDRKFDLIMETKKTEITVKDDIAYKRYKVSAIDNNGDESKFANIYKNTLMVGIKPEFVLPVGKLSDLFSMGFGFSADISYIGLLFSGSVISFNTGYLRWIGGADNIDYMNMIPLMLSAGYKYNFTESFAVRGMIGAGGVFMNTGMTDATMQDVTVNGFEFIFSENVNLIYNLNDKFSISGGVKFYSVYESSGLKSFAGVEAGMTYLFF
ncbi:MAG: hypothetical protein JW982_12965 [Spirochaetes bacterium]|nr:hypothetical protein [Spirochaetota bacterium]